MVSKKEILERVALLEQDIDSIAIKLDKFSKVRSSDKVMIDGLARKLMAMEEKLCTCKPGPKLVKAKKKFQSETERRFYNAMKATKQPRDKSGKFVKK